MKLALLASAALTLEVIRCTVLCDTMLCNIMFQCSILSLSWMKKSGSSVVYLSLLQSQIAVSKAGESELSCTQHETTAFLVSLPRVPVQSLSSAKESLKA